MIDFSKVREQVEQGYIAVQKHPTADLSIYNYTAKAQFEWNWTPEIRACRGLIADSSDNVMARPFAKFFNLESCPDPIPVEPFEVYEKLDGSLGILYWVDGKPAIATRGSFTSPQAQWATAKLRSWAYPRPQPDRTYLFEIIYPENRIVIDYGNFANLVLLAVIDTVTGKELPLEDLGFPMVTKYDGITDLETIRDQQDSNREGYVIRFESGMRVKVKFDEYKRLHKLITGINPRHVWEELMAGRPLEPFLERVPDEYYNWFTGVRDEIQTNYSEIENRCRADFKDLGERKESALYYQTCPYPAVLFRMLDGRDYSDIIWKLVRPKAATAFKCDEVG